MRPSWSSTFLVLLTTSLPFNLPHVVSGFTVPTLSKHSTFASSISKTKLYEEAGSTDDNDTSNLDIVLFGVGDLRTNDHQGLYSALSSATSNEILPLLILSTSDTLKHLPGARSYTINTAKMMSSAISDLSESLMKKYGLKLQIEVGDSVTDVLSSVLDKNKEGKQNINVHVYDAGPADNLIGMSPYPYLLESSDLFSGVVSMIPWNCRLREKPWESVLEDPSSFPTTNPSYCDNYCSDDTNVIVPLELSEELKRTNDQAEENSVSVSEDHILSLLKTALDLEDSDDDNIAQSENTGLFGTGWGGIHGSVCSETETLTCLDEFIEKSRCDHDAFLKNHWYTKGLAHNPASLEHATLSWMASGGDAKRMSNENLIEGEMLVRYLAAPLFFGCISKRQIYDLCVKSKELKSLNYLGLPWRKTGTTKILKEMVENREWHELFAAKNILQERKENSPTLMGEIQSQYWRWHGFLCRYSSSDLSMEEEQNKNAFLLVHGFGASSNQFRRLVAQLATVGSSENFPQSVFAPDLIGFGQCEKPSLTYTQYLWESYIQSFAKEVVLPTKENFILGGNSIGGYTSMACAADDTIGSIKSDDQQTITSASGAPGTQKCTGLILMNSAGKVFSKEDIAKMKSEAASKSEGKVKEVSVAQMTNSIQGLGPCKPPPRPVAYLFATFLLSNLRSRIEKVTVPLYPSNPDNVDDDLCDKNIRRDSLDPGAINVMMSGSKLPPPRTANELLASDHGASTVNTSHLKEGQFKGSVLIAQGMKDPLNDATGRAYDFKGLRDGIELYPLHEGGHCPHDELPEDMAKGIKEWISMAK